jgi:hypothetical protein
MRHDASERDLQLQVRDIRTAYPKLKDHEAFIVWFLHAMVTDDIDKGASALTGNSRDKGADAILIDDRAKVAFIIQGKYHSKIRGSAEPRSDVMAFSHFGRDCFGSLEDWSNLLKGCDPRVHQRLGEVRERLTKRNYSLKLYYVTTGRCSDALVSQAERECKKRRRTDRD